MITTRESVNPDQASINHKQPVPDGGTLRANQPMLVEKVILMVLLVGLPLMLLLTTLNLFARADSPIPAEELQRQMMASLGVLIVGGIFLAYTLFYRVKPAKYIGLGFAGLMVLCCVMFLVWGMVEQIYYSITAGQNFLTGGGAQGGVAVLVALLALVPGWLGTVYWREIKLLQPEKSA